MSLPTLYAVMFMVLVLIMAACVYLLVSVCVSQGQPYLTLASLWLASPLSMAWAAYFVECRPFLLTGIWHQSWSFLFGDIIVLPVAVALLVKANHHLPEWPTWHNGHETRYRMGCFAAGMAIGGVFHLTERAHYASSVWNSPVELFYDLCVVPTLWGSLLFACLPLFMMFRHWPEVFWPAFVRIRPFVAGASLCLLVWLALVGLDYAAHPGSQDTYATFDWNIL